MKFLKHLAQGALVGTVVAILANVIGGWLGAMLYIGFFFVVGYGIFQHQAQREADETVGRWLKAREERRKEMANE